MTVHSALWCGVKARKNSVTRALFIIFPEGINNKSLRCRLCFTSRRALLNKSDFG